MGLGWSIVPWGLRDLLLYVQRRYSPPGGIIITENGCAHEPSGSAEQDRQPGALEPKPFDASTLNSEDWDHDTFEDPERVRFFKAHLSAVAAARAKGADVRG